MLPGAHGLYQLCRTVRPPPHVLDHNDGIVGIGDGVARINLFEDVGRENDRSRLRGMKGVGRADGEPVHRRGVIMRRGKFRPNGLRCHAPHCMFIEGNHFDLKHTP